MLISYILNTLTVTNSFRMLHRSADRMFVDLLSESFLFGFLVSWNLSCLDSFSLIIFWSYLKILFILSILRIIFMRLTPLPFYPFLGLLGSLQRLRHPVESVSCFPILFNTSDPSAAGFKGLSVSLMEQLGRFSFLLKLIFHLLILLYQYLFTLSIK